MEFNTLCSWKAKRCIKLNWCTLNRIWAGSWEHPLAHLAWIPAGSSLGTRSALSLIHAGLHPSSSSSSSWSMQVSNPSWDLAFKLQNIEGMGWCLCTLSKVLNLVIIFIYASLFQCSSFKDWTLQFHTVYLDALQKYQWDWQPNAVVSAVYFN